MLTPVDLQLLTTRSLDDDQRPLRALHQTLYLMLAVQKPINAAALEVQSKLQNLDAVREALIKQSD